MKILDLPKVERPREKLVHYGSDKLSNAELLAIILGTGGKGINVVELSNKILKKFNNNLAEASLEELKTTFGLGEAKACEIIACFELGRRFLKDKKFELILAPGKVWDELKGIRDSKKEHFVVFYLDTRNQVIRQDIISIGTLNASLVHPREVFEPAIQYNAAQIIIAHNHPTGDTAPSVEDKKITERLQEAGKILGIEIIDHIIVVDKSWLSFREAGIMK